MKFDLSNLDHDAFIEAAKEQIQGMVEQHFDEYQALFDDVESTHSGNPEDNVFAALQTGAIARGLEPLPQFRDAAATISAGGHVHVDVTYTSD